MKRWATVAVADFNDELQHAISGEVADANHALSLPNGAAWPGMSFLEFDQKGLIARAHVAQVQGETTEERDENGQ